MILSALQTNDRVQKAWYYDSHLEKNHRGQHERKVHNNRSMTTVHDFVKGVLSGEYKHNFYAVDNFLKYRKNKMF